MSDIVEIALAISLLIAAINIFIAVHHELKKAQKIWGEKRR